MIRRTATFLLVFALMLSCTDASQKEQDASNVTDKTSDKIPVLFDSDTNNELDDQHALAYLLFNGESFNVRGVTVNATFNGGEILEHYTEAGRILQLCSADGEIPLYSGANADFENSSKSITEQEYDGKDAVEFIIEEARQARNQKLVLLPVGKLTNIALALLKAPDIKDRVRIVWLGSNYPEPGEYNQVNDVPALNYILGQDVPFEMVMVRYGKPSGSDAVRVTPDEIERNMPGLGPVTSPVTGRHGNTFKNFGDYSVDLFRNAKMHGDPPSRAMFDMVAVAIVKNPTWGEAKEIPAPVLDGKNWKERPDNNRKVVVWENFDKKAILTDFFDTMRNPVIAERK